jgi:GMP synthase (glutamine-hydrolysing)
MPRAVALRHVAFEDLGSLAPLLERRGWSVAYCDTPVGDLEAPDLAAADLLVVLGGPIGAYQDELYPFLRGELRLIEHRLGAGRPVLGICLGAQLMARALGSRVYPGPAKEIGWSPLALSPAGRSSSLAALGEDTAVLHWHDDTFDLPEGAVHLAATGRCRNQAFAFGRHALALQCHLEVTEGGLEAWYVGHALEIAGAAGVSVAALRTEGKRRAPLLAPRAASCFGAWLEGCA